MEKEYFLLILANSFSMHGGAQCSGCSPSSGTLASSCRRLFVTVAQFILLSSWTQDGCCQLESVINNFHSGAQKSAVGNTFLLAYEGKLSLSYPNINTDAVKIDGEKRKREKQSEIHTEKERKRIRQLNKKSSEILISL